MTSSILLALAVSLPAANGEPVTKLPVKPMAAPTPALKYQLLPEVREQNPGNSVQWYLRCFAEQRNFFFTRESNNLRQRYREMPLAELAKEGIANYGGNALSQADWGARLESQDWDSIRKVQTEGADLRLPEMSAFRVLAIALQVRLRGEVARGEYDDAIRTAKTMFAFARHLGDHPTRAGNQLGLEVAGLALHTLEEMIQQPTAPNLYWAYTELPRTLVEIRRGFQGDRVIVDLELAGLRSDAAMTDEELEAFISKLSGRIGSVREEAGRPPKNVRAAIRTLVDDRERAARIRNRLLKDAPSDGIGEKVSALKILSFPPLQLVLLDEKHEFERRRDDALKLVGLAPWQIDAVIKNKASGDRGLFGDFLPSVVEQRRAQARVEQRIAMLACIEAIRLHAADHAALPAKLDQIGVPVPNDPLTGKSFGYSVEGEVVKLSGEGKSYEIRMGARKP